jgi:hypothetical protein
LTVDRTGTLTVGLLAKPGPGSGLHLELTKSRLELK